MANVRPHDESSVARGRREPLGDVRLAREWCSRLLVLHELHAGQEPAAPHVTHERKLTQPCEPVLQHGPDCGAPLDQSVRAQVFNGGEARRTEHGVVRERLRMVERARPAREDVGDPRRRHHGRERRVAARDPFAQHHDVRHDAAWLERRPRAGSPCADQHLVGDEEYVVAVADLPNASEVVGRWNRGARRRAAHRLGNERRDRLGLLTDDRLLQRRTVARGAVRRQPAAPAAIGVRRGDAHDVHQPVAIDRAIVLARRGRECEQRVPVVGGSERNDLVLAGAPALQPVLTRQLERGLDGIGTARQRVDAVEVSGSERGHLGGELLDRIVRERRAAHVGEPSCLLCHRVGDLGDAVPHVHDEGAAAGIEECVAVGVVEPAARATRDDGESRVQLPEEDVRLREAVCAHDRSFAGTPRSPSTARPQFDPRVPQIRDESFRAERAPRTMGPFAVNAEA